MKTLITASLLTLALASGPAFAQGAQPADRGTTAATTDAAGATDKAALKDSWRASKLVGLDVYNDNNEKLGDINELILDKSGKVKAVIIGVGGFLGMGEHDIAVSMDKLKFVEEPIRTSATAPARDTTATAPAGRDTTATAPAGRDTTTGAATTTAPARTTTTNDWAPDHAVMSATKDQLKGMPQFKYSEYN